MKKKARNYRIICPTVGGIFPVKSLGIKEEAELFSKIALKINSFDNPIKLDSYKRYIIGKLLANPSVIHLELEEDEKIDDESKQIIDEIYSNIIEIYPTLSLEEICAWINYNVFVSDPEKRKEMRKFNLLPIKTAKKKEKFTQSKVKKLEQVLRKKVIGQDEAIDKIIDYVKLQSAGLIKYASVFFIGRTGTGKTLLAKTVGEEYYGNFFKINCANFSHGHEYAALIGAPRGYVGFTEKSLLAEKAEISNKWVFLFDEIEKAHPKFFNFLLALLDEGIATDNLGKELDFSESLFIFTSNEGMSEVSKKPVGFNSKDIKYDDCVDLVDTSIKKKFNPEFYNRIDHFVHFNELDEEAIEKIIALELNYLPIKKTKSLVKYILKNAYSLEYGARNIRRFIKSDIAIKIADAILAGKKPNERTGLFSVRIAKDNLEVINSNNLNRGRNSNKLTENNNG